MRTSDFDMKQFDPFNDRTSRDIRNRLSEAFVSAIKKQDPDAVQREVDAMMPLVDEGAYRHYIKDRREKYWEVLDRIAVQGIEDVRQQAIVIWNAGLFFECHDHLEMLWSNTTGRERKALQGFIQAAGVFVHRQLGRRGSADRLSSKAVRLLEDYRRELAFIDNLDDLINAIKQNGADAPKLKGK